MLTVSYKSFEKDELPSLEQRYLTYDEEVVKTLSDISDKINTGVILIPTDLDEHITTLRLSTASESNSIAGINIQKKDLPRQATKT